MILSEYSTWYVEPIFILMDWFLYDRDPVMKELTGYYSINLFHINRNAWENLGKISEQH